MPLGNGKLGVMVFGNTSTERIQLNDDSMRPFDDKNLDTIPTDLRLEQVKKGAVNVRLGALLF